MENPAWNRLTRSENIAIWSSVDKRLGFRPSINEKDFPGFKEPAPSITYSFRNIWDGNFSELETDLQKMFSRMFQMATPVGEFVYALDWQHQGYRFYPDRASRGNDDWWPISAFPNGDYHLFIAKSFEFGWLGHPWEQTICLFGKPLLAALKNNKPRVFKDPIRRLEQY